MIRSLGKSVFIWMYSMYLWLKTQVANGVRWCFSKAPAQAGRLVSAPSKPFSEVWRAHFNRTIKSMIKKDY